MKDLEQQLRSDANRKSRDARHTGQEKIRSMRNVAKSVAKTNVSAKPSTSQKKPSSRGATPGSPAYCSQCEEHFCDGCDADTHGAFAEQPSLF